MRDRDIDKCRKALRRGESTLPVKELFTPERRGLLTFLGGVGVSKPLLAHRTTLDGKVLGEGILLRIGFPERQEPIKSPTC